MAKKSKDELSINQKIIDKEEHKEQALVKTKTKSKKEKIVIACASTEKLSLFSIGNDSIEKASLSFSSTITPSTNEDSEKISLSGDEGNKKSRKGSAKTKTQTISQIIKGNQDSKISSSFSDTHFSIVFEGAKLLTPNVIFSALQYHKYDVFSYKKSWHTIIARELERLNAEHLKGKSAALPFFKDSVQVTILRSAPTLVDEDAVVIMFKYIIDALKRDDKTNPYGILADDNPKIIFKSESFNEKGANFVAIRLEYVPDIEKEQYNIEKILRMPTAKP